MMDNRIKRGWRLGAGAAALIACAASWAAGPLEALRVEFPALHRLYETYPQHHAKLDDYAAKQNFRRPFERLGVVVHELVHLDSYGHQGYFIDGVYYEPYLNRSSWPSLSNKELLERVPPDQLGGTYHRYVANAPANHLGNVVDEINAYGHVMPFICKHEPESAQVQTNNLISFLQLQETYLRLLREGSPAEYQALVRNRESRGVMVEVTLRARRALRACGARETAIPYQEMAHFSKQQ